MGYVDRSISAEDMDDYSGNKVIVTSIVFIILTSLFLGLRFYAKNLVRSQSGWDDLLLVGAYLCNTGSCITVIVMTKVAGLGRHEEWLKNSNPTQMVRWAELVLTFEFFHFAGEALPKLAILSFYIQMFNWRGKTRAVCYVTMGTVVTAWLASTVGGCLQCRPLAFWWDKTIRGGECFEMPTLFRAQAITSPILDVIILLLPIKSIWALQLPERKRIELILVYGVAGFGLIASIVRVQIFFGTSTFIDRTWVSVDIGGWSISEVGTYIITACLPVLGPLAPLFSPARLLAKARKMMRISDGVQMDSNPPSKDATNDDHHDFPSMVTHNSITQGQFNDCGPWDGAHQDKSIEEPRGGQQDEDGSHEESYQEETSERINWEGDGILTILITRTTQVTVDRLGSIDRPWEFLGPSIGSPTITSG
ncbi:integral membrane protein [Diaporthe helianthi]|uniref:Integral membrane protein n=1 Tax=Diaporthe helianthi TaxID=158607 RepID=A0A2P5I7N6_DIAHE|nr:integral membrane protein [Diaporthe helianthi]